MKRLMTTVLIALLPLAALAQTPLTLAADTAAHTADSTNSSGAPAETDPGPVAEDALMDDDIIEGLPVYDATEIALDDFLWLQRLIVIFANTPNDPAFEQQVRYLQDRADEMIERDVVVVLDTDPAAMSDARERLRPRGFMLAIIDKDGEVKQRRPAPRSGRELMAVIDRFPLRRQEIMDRMPSGRD